VLILVFFNNYFFLKNTKDNFVWAVTNVYGPVLSHLKPLFWTELLNLFSLGIDNWVIEGDFNTIRTQNEKYGSSFDLRQTSMFNVCISSYTLLDYKGNNNKFSWAHGFIVIIWLYLIVLLLHLVGTVADLGF
jgi:hypothetical protein